MVRATPVTGIPPTTVGSARSNASDSCTLTPARARGRRWRGTVISTRNGSPTRSNPSKDAALRCDTSAGPWHDSTAAIARFRKLSATPPIRNADGPAFTIIPPAERRRIHFLVAPQPNICLMLTIECCSSANF